MAREDYLGLSSGFDSQKSLLYSALEREVSRFDIPFPEISRSLAEVGAESLYQVDFLSRKDFVDTYKKGRLMQEISSAKGNLTQVTRTLYQVDDPERVNVLRRNVNDNVSRFGLWDYVNGKRPWKSVSLEDSVGSCSVPLERVESALLSGLDNYKSVLHPQVYSGIQKNIVENVPLIARSVERYVPSEQSTVDYLVRQTAGMSWDESVRHVEKVAVDEAMRNAGGNKHKAAEYLGDSLKTLSRKLSMFDCSAKACSVPKDASCQVNGEKKSSGSDVSRLKELLSLRSSSNSSVSEEKKPDDITSRISSAAVTSAVESDKLSRPAKSSMPDYFALLTDDYDLAA